MEIEREKKIEQVEDILKSLSSIYRTHSLYPPTHPTYQNNLEECYSKISEYFNFENEIIIVIFNNEFVYLDKPLFRDRKGISEFTKPFIERGCNRICFEKSLTKNEIISLIELLYMDLKKIEEMGGFDICIAKKDLTNIKLDQIFIKKEDSNEYRGAQKHTKEGTHITDLPFRMKSPILKIKSVAENLFNLNISQAPQQYVQKIIQEAKGCLPIIISVAKDNVNLYQGKEYIYNEQLHAANVAILSLRILYRLNIGLGDTQLENFVVAAFLHDIGKMLLPEKIRKTSSVNISEDDSTLYQSHTLKGAEFFSTQVNIDPIFLIVAYEHHLGYDSSGFPQLIKNKGEIIQPNYLANIVSVCNKWDHFFEGDLRIKNPKMIFQRLQKNEGKAFHPSLLLALQQ